MIWALVILGIGNGVMASNSYQTSYLWDFNNNCYLTFNNTVPFLSSPFKGVPVDSSLTGYWDLNEGTGMVVHDSTLNQNNGTINSPLWIIGKYGNALNFTGKNNYVNVPNSVSLNQTSQITISFWTKFVAGDVPAVEKGGSYLLYWDGSSQIFGRVYQNSAIVASGVLPDGNWHLIVYTYAPNSQQALYVDGALVKAIATGNVSIASNINPLRFGYIYSASRSGSIDDVRIYNRALNAGEVMVLYMQPDPVCVANYYNYQDSVTNNTIIICVENPQTDNSVVTLVSCTNFFNDNRLIFVSNNSATINLWSSLGKPTFTNGVWDSENYTTTLMLNVSSIAELDWNRLQPFAFNLQASVANAGNTTFFSFLWADNRSLSDGGFIFSTNNTGQWVNSTWTAFNSTPDWGNVTLTLNNAVGMTVGFREYANNTLNLWGDSGIYTLKTTVNYIITTTPTPSATATPTPTASPTINETTIPIATSTPTPSPTSITNITPNSSSKPTPITNQIASSPTQNVLIATTIICSLMVVFAVSFKKGFISVEVVDEESEESVVGVVKTGELDNHEKSPDYSI